MIRKNTEGISIALKLKYYGALLLIIGVVGYLSNPAKAKSALFSGLGFGTLSFVWGVLLDFGFYWACYGALLSTGLLSAILSWRGVLGWLAVWDGNNEKLLASLLVSAMLLASIAVLPHIYKATTSIGSRVRVH